MKHVIHELKKYEPQKRLTIDNPISLPFEVVKRAIGNVLSLHWSWRFQTMPCERLSKICLSGHGHDVATSRSTMVEARLGENNHCVNFSGAVLTPIYDFLRLKIALKCAILKATDLFNGHAGR